MLSNLEILSKFKQLIDLKPYIELKRIERDLIDSEVEILSDLKDLID